MNPTNEHVYRSEGSPQWGAFHHKRPSREVLRREVTPDSLCTVRHGDDVQARNDLEQVLRRWDPR